MGVWYSHGYGGLPADEVQALGWYRKAAALGDAEAMHNIGFYYEKGKGGLRPNDAEALAWYRKGASTGYADSLTSIGFLL